LPFAALVAEGLTIQQIAERLGIGATTVRYWLRKYGLRTARAAASAARSAVARRCPLGAGA